MDARMSRRELLCRGGMGMGALMLADLIGQALNPALALAEAGADDAPALNPLAPRKGQFPGKAKRVIHIFANGGPSHVDTFDPKPALERQSGKPLPSEFQKGGNTKGNTAFPSSFKFRKYGQSGIEVSEIFPNLAQSVDDLCVIRGMYADDPNHEPSLLLMNCGEPRLSRPSMGSWLTYGLGTENQNLPGFIAMCPGGYPIYQSQNWQSGFLPGIFQGTYIDTQHTEVDKLVENVRNGRITNKEQQEQLVLLRELNREHRETRADDPQLEARIQSFELAYRMQMDATDAFDVMREPQHIRDMYGTGTQARQMMIARRLLERGVRFVQVWTGRDQPWDNHADIQPAISRLAKDSDQALGALIRDLKQRGMLDDTLVIWGGEFGRTPTVEGRPGKNAGRDHQSSGFSMWMAGGGVKRGHVQGATDEFGVHAIADGKVHVHDLHATILHLMGFDHEKFTYRYAGRDFRLTDVHGRVVKEMIA
jgi:Protein of unknown function (DUF1501)